MCNILNVTQYDFYVNLTTAIDELFILTDQSAGVDHGYLERGFVYIKVLGLRFADFISNFLNCP